MPAHEAVSDAAGGGQRIVRPLGKAGWFDATVVCIASGPSLCPQDIDEVRQWRDSGKGRKVIVVNTTYISAPWADVLYAADKEWWNYYAVKVKSEFAGELWSCQEIEKPKGVNSVIGIRGCGVSVMDGSIHLGSNSGFQAITLAQLFGAKKIILLGYDMQFTGGQVHHHGRHPFGLRNPYRPERWATEVDVLARDLEYINVSLINSSRETAIQYVCRKPLKEALYGD